MSTAQLPSILIHAREALERRRRSAEMAEEYRKSFRKFIPAAWPVVEPSRTFKPAWHIDHIAEHLQAQANGQIQNLLINISPGSAKSLLCSVLFPAWMWADRPGWRSTCSSYDSGLATRDSVRCRDLIQSVWYKETFQPTWSLANDQNEKTYYVNTAKGFRVSTSVGGRGTGWRSDHILCLHAGTKIETDRGPIDVDQIVERELPVRVKAFNHATGLPAWRQIEAYESSVGRESVRVTMSDGTYINCTHDHPFFVSGSGYIPAVELKHGAKVITSSQLLKLRSNAAPSPGPHNQSQTRPVLQQRMQRRIQEENADVPVRFMWQVALPKPNACGPSAEAILQSGMFRARECRRTQSGLRWRVGVDGMPRMRQAVPGSSGQEGIREVLQQAVYWRGVQRREQPEIRQYPDCSLWGLRETYQATKPQPCREAELLQQGVLGRSPQQIDGGRAESQLYAWPRARRIPAKVQAHCPADQETGWPEVPDVRQGKVTDETGCRRAPHRLRQAKQRSVQPRLPVPGMPRRGARCSGEAYRGPAVTVVSVERIATPARVFNIRVAEDHNYFANGILLHNCDDPINVTDQFSDAAIEFCKNWWDGTMYNRLQDMETGTRLIIMQRVSDRDLSGHVLRTGGWEHLMIPMEYDPTRSKVTVIGSADPRKERGELMAPEIFSAAVIADTKRTLGQSGYAGQYQQSPAPDGGGILKSHLWKYWQPAGANLPPVRVKMMDGTIDERKPVDRPDTFDLEIQAWDFAFKDLKTSDYVAGMHVGVRGAGRYIGSHLAHDKMDLPASISAVRIMTGQYPKAHLKLVEDKANGPAVIQSLRHEIPGLVEVSPQGGKIARVSAATPELEAGNWYLPHPMVAPWVGDPENPTKGGFLAETVSFPFGANDDMCDCFSMAALRIQQEKIGGVFGVSESDIRVDLFEIGEKWPRLYGMAATWYEVGAVWICRRPETDQHYAYAEYCAAPTNLAHHAAELVKPGAWIPGVITAIDSGRDEKDGYAMVGKYRKMGLILDTTPPNEESMILELQDALVTGKLKVFGALARLMDEYRMFRRDEKGRLPERNDCLIKALYVAWAGRKKAKAPAEPPKPERGALYRSQAPQDGWMRS